MIEFILNDLNGERDRHHLVPVEREGTAQVREGVRRRCSYEQDSLVVMWLKWPMLWYSQVSSLLIGQLSEVDIEGGKMKASDILICNQEGREGGSE